MNTQPQRQTPILKLHRTQQERKKVSVEDGYTQIPNELLFAMGQFGFTQRQYSVLIAVIQKTISWHKETDWICNEQLCELTGIVGEHKVSAVKNELIRMNVLVQQGRKIGVNLAVSEWEKTNLPEKGNLTQKGKTNLPEKGNRVYPKQVTTKETITKEKINNTPLPPTGQSAVADEQADGLAEKQHQVAENQQAPTACKKTKLSPVDYAGVAQAYNESVTETDRPLPKVADPENLSDKRKRAIHRLAKQFQKRFGDYSPAAFKNYFTDFMGSAPEWYFGKNDRGWRAGFEYLLREEILDKTIEGGL